MARFSMNRPRYDPPVEMPSSSDLEALFDHAQVFRSGAPVFRDSFIERARITPGALPDVGATVDGPVPICGNVYHAAPGTVMRHERERIENAIPRLGPTLWLAYMKEIAAKSPGA
jgi:hypothetical protein